MHMREMDDSEGTFSEAVDAKTNCRTCGSKNVKVREWESNCGGYTDWKFECGDCHHYWWVEGPDA